MRNFNIFNRKGFAEDQIIGQAEKGLKKDDDSENNRRSSFQSQLTYDGRLPEDEYVTKQQREMAKIDDEEGAFTNANGRQTLIKDLDAGDTATLLEIDKYSDLKQADTNERLKEEGDDNIEASPKPRQQIENKKQTMQSRYLGSKSEYKFYAGQYVQEKN